MGSKGNRTFYLATVPAVFEEVGRPASDAAGLNRRRTRRAGAVRLVIEKPFRPRISPAPGISMPPFTEASPRGRSTA